MNKSNMLGIMADCSRNAVLTVDAAKKFIDCMQKMGYNTLMLYTEDTYEVDGHPYFGYLRGRYSKEELRTLDSYAAQRGVELIPCIQTLAHLNAIFRWPQYNEICDTDDILLAENEKTLAFIESMFATLRGCVKTDKIHIGMDEAQMLGLGKYLNEHGFCKRSSILLRHLKSVCELAEKYGFKPLMWSDMFFRLANNGEYYGELSDEAAAEVAPLIPENVTLFYWDYYSTNKQKYLNMIRSHKKMCGRLAFAGGIWTWPGYAPRNTLALDVTRPAIEACNEEGLRDVLITAWGDNGADCSLFASLPAFFYAAELYRGNSDMQAIKAKFKELFGEDFDGVMSLEKIDIPVSSDDCHSSSKATLFNDVLMGVNDLIIPEDAPQKYLDVAKHFDEMAKESAMFKTHFTCFAAFARALSEKCTLGKDLRCAYKAGDRQTLEDICQNRLPKAAAEMKKFLSEYRKLWMLEKKPHGFDVQEIRIGGTIARIEGAAVRLREYLDGEAETIPELCETILPHTPEACVWSRMASTNVLV